MKKSHMVRSGERGGHVRSPNRAINRPVNNDRTAAIEDRTVYAVAQYVSIKEQILGRLKAKVQEKLEIFVIDNGLHLGHVVYKKE